MLPSCSGSEKSWVIEKIKEESTVLKFEVVLNCGCCTDILEFPSIEAIDSAFKATGLTVNAAITDAKGKTVKGVDTFYGYRLADSKEEGHLERLFNNLNGFDGGRYRK